MSETTSGRRRTAKAASKRLLRESRIQESQWSANRLDGRPSILWKQIFSVMHLLYFNHSAFFSARRPVKRPDVGISWHSWPPGRSPHDLLVACFLLRVTNLRAPGFRGSDPDQWPPVQHSHSQNVSPHGVPVDAWAVLVGWPTPDLKSLGLVKPGLEIPCARDVAGSSF